MERLTDISTIRALCEKHGFSLSKGFGQHFLVNAGICPKICDVAGIGQDTCVLEVGPGFGTLTRELAQRAKKVASLEVDTRLLPVLDETLAGFDNVSVISGDAMKADLESIIHSELFGRAVVCANLPYNITSPILMRLLESRLPLDGITVMVQLEAAKRLTAQPGTREAGAITYAVHYHCVPRYDFAVNPGSFFPPPKVKSAVITLTPRPQRPLEGEPEREKRLFSLIRAGFGKRRKTLQNAAGDALDLPKATVAAALRTAGLNEQARPEQLTLEDFIRLEHALWP